MFKLLFLLFLILILVGCIPRTTEVNRPTAQRLLPKQSTTEQPAVEQPTVEPAESKLVPPTQEFKTRITKKPFGIFIDPKTSPVQPERFSGYHTGVDIEYIDAEYEVPVLAIADGLVERSDWVSGYGGVIAIRHTVGNKEYLAVYGHLNPDSLVAKGKSVVKGEQIGILGTGNTTQTDGERKHLHFSLYTGNDINLRGYVANSEQLSAWLDPQTIF